MDLFELREDPRNEDAAAGRSINLALSDRGMRALRQIGMEDECLKAGVKMFARMIHNKDGSTYAVPYGRTGKVLIFTMEINPVIKFKKCVFRHKLFGDFFVTL